MNYYIVFNDNETVGLSTDAHYQEIAETINNIRKSLRIKFTYTLGYNKFNKRYDTEFYRLSQLVQYILDKNVLFGGVVEPKKEFPEILKTNYRIIGYFTKGYNIKFEFYNGETDNSHHQLFSKVLNDERVYIDWDAMKCSKIIDNVSVESTGVFGAFYSLMVSNDEIILCIYGSSCDYPTSKLTDRRLRDYKNELKLLCEQKKWKLLWKV